MTFADRLEELRKAATPVPWKLAHDGDSSLIYVDYPDIGIKLAIGEIYSNMKDTDTEIVVLLRNNADAIVELVRAAGEIPEILRNWEPDHSSGLERKKIVAFQSALAKLNGEQT